MDNATRTYLRWPPVGHPLRTQLQNIFEFPATFAAAAYPATLGPSEIISEIAFVHVAVPEAQKFHIEPTPLHRIFTQRHFEHKVTFREDKLPKLRHYNVENIQGKYLSNILFLSALNKISISTMKY